MEKRTRVRNVADWFDFCQYPKSYAEKLYYPPGNPVPFSDTVTPLSVTRPLNVPAGQQITVDEIHKLFEEIDKQTDLVKSRPDRFIGDIGGPFDSTKSAVLSDSTRRDFVVDKVRGTGDFATRGVAHYVGPVWAIHPGTISPPSPPLSDLREKGTTAIARCKPTNSVADVGVLLGETFHEGLPKLFGATLWKDRTNLAKGSSGEFLNYQFGWAPVVSDIKSIAYAATHSHELLSQYERAAGKIVRRRYEFPLEVTETSTTIGANPGYLANIDSVWLYDDSVPTPYLQKTTRTYKRTWFSGAFTYHLPVGYNSRIGLADAAAKASVLYGLELSPEVIWNLAPWSWAVDWFTNMGDVISNLSSWALDGLVLKWGYIMEHSYAYDTYTLSGLSPYGKGGTSASPVTAFTERKRREVATPFGFGLTWEGLSPRQLAISAALGITRVFH